MLRITRITVLTLLVLSLAALPWVGCDRTSDVASTSTVTEQDIQGPQLLSRENPRVRAVIDVQEKYTARMMENKDVVGTAVGLNDAGEVVVKIYLAAENPRLKIPERIDGIKIVPEVTGVIRAMGKPGGGGGVSHTAKQTAPIQLGTSGGWRYDLANGYCCGGTLGSLIQIGGTKYILSNYHVLNADIVNGGNSRVATNGDPVIQPGLIDVSCNAANAQNVATLADANSPSLPGSNVDAAIAQVVTGMVRDDGSILEVGTLSASTVGASINQTVKKSGRTTGLSRSSISGLNATISVAYDNECAGGAAFTKTYTGQIVIKNRRSGFLNSGDSGSLMVEDVATNPRAVGLLYAGSNTTAIANPIGQVLSHYGATMVGQ